MKRSGQVAALVLVPFFAFSQSVPGADQIQLQLKKSAAQGEIEMHSQMALPVSAMYPEYVIQQSSNLVNWTAVAGPFSGSVGVSDELLRVAVPTTGAHAFYRVVANVKLAAGGVIGRDAPDLEQGTGIVPPLGLLHVLLKAQERGALGEEDGEGRQRYIGYCKLPVGVGACIGQTGRDGALALDYFIKSGAHSCAEECRYDAKSTSYNRVTTR